MSRWERQFGASSLEPSAPRPAEPNDASIFATSSSVPAGPELHFLPSDQIIDYQCEAKAMSPNNLVSYHNRHIKLRISAF